MSEQTSKFIVPTKSASDKREYRIITLKNGLDCILVSDPETEKAAGALSVNVGHFADPDEVPGLAHFLEHMLFLGTEKYPDEQEYNRYLKDHGGGDNAATAMKWTCYQFDVHRDHLAGALDRFAQFFIAPLFTESATDREMKAVNSENENNLQNDPHRLFQLDKSLANEKHPFHKFGTGNLATLRDNVPKHIDVRKTLLQFHKEYYSASIMKLVIIGKENLDELTKYAEDMFSEIKNTGRKAPEYGKEVFDQKLFPLLLKIVPVKEKRELILGWPMEPCEPYYLERPEYLLSFCLGDEGPGSVLALLKKLGLATELSAGTDYNTSEFALFRVSVSLTPEGLKNWERIVEIIYRYIAKMSALTDERWAEYWEERKKVKTMNFAFKSKESPYDYATVLAQYAHQYPLDHLLEFVSGMFFKCDTKLVKRFLKYLNTDNCLIQLVSKEFESECKETEKWYGTLYQRVNLTSEQLKQWKELEPSENDKFLFTPPPNPYIADDFTLFCEKSEDKKTKSTESDEKELSEAWLGNPPEVVVSTDQLRLWFKMDEYFKQPKLGVKFKIISPVAAGSCINQMMTNLLLTCFQDVMSELTYTFAEASLSSHTGFDNVSGINVDFFGYNQKLPALVETVLSKLGNFELSEEQFEVNLERYKRQIQSLRKAKAHQQIGLFENYILNPRGYSLEDLEKGITEINYKKLMSHYTNVFEKIFVEGLIYGNAEVDQVKGIYAKLIQTHILKDGKSQIYPLKDYAASRKGSLIIPANGNSHALRFENFNANDNNSAIGNNYFFKTDTPKDWSVVRLMSHMTSVPCFDQLRTKEQLGYLVWSFPDNAHGTMSFRIVIQSTVAHPIKLDERIELFLQEYRKELAATTTEVLESNKEGVINDLLEKTKGISQQMAHYWMEFDNGRYQFDRRSKVAKEVAALNLEALLTFYDEVILGTKGKLSKLTVQCFDKNNKIPELTDEEAKTSKIHLLTPDSIAAFREKCGYYPFPYEIPLL